MAESNDDPSKRPARPAVPPFFGPAGGQRTPSRPGGALPPRPAGPFIGPWSRAITPPAVTPVRANPSPAAPVAPAAPPVAASSEPVPQTVWAPTPDPTPSTASETPPDTAIATPEQDVPTPLAGLPIIGGEFATPETASPERTTDTSETLDDDGPSERFLHAPTGEYPTEPASDLVSFAPSSETSWERPEPAPEASANEAWSAAPEAPPDTPSYAVSDASGSAGIDAFAGGAETAAAAPDVSGDDVPAAPAQWAGWPSEPPAAEAPAASVAEGDGEAAAAADPDSVDETGLWAPAWPTEEATETTEAADWGGAAHDRAPEPPADEIRAESGGPTVEESPPPQEDYALVLDRPGTDPTGESLPLGAEPEDSPVDGLAGVGEPAAAFATEHVVSETGGHGPWSDPTESQPPASSDAGETARADLAERIASVAQRVRNGELSIPHLESLRSDEAALAAALAALLAPRR